MPLLQNLKGFLVYLSIYPVLVVLNGCDGLLSAVLVHLNVSSRIRTTVSFSYQPSVPTSLLSRGRGQSRGLEISVGSQSV